MRLAWATDLHLDFKPSGGEEGARRLCADARGHDGLLLTGGIANAAELGRWLRFLHAELDAPIWFVLGEHDHQGSSITAVREGVRALCREVDGLVRVPDVGVLPLTSKTALLGVDGWADARLGVWGEPPQGWLHGAMQIEELRRAAAPQVQPDGSPDLGRLRKTLQRLGVEAAQQLKPCLHAALSRFEEVIVLTHVPPLAQAAWQDRHKMSAGTLPYFTCAAVGEVLMAAAESWPRRRIRVLCGHTQSGGVVHPRRNLEVRTGEVGFGWPSLAGVVEVV